VVTTTAAAPTAIVTTSAAVVAGMLALIALACQRRAYRERGGQSQAGSQCDCDH